jgi:hypothetical protein
MAIVMGFVEGFFQRYRDAEQRPLFPGLGQGVLRSLTDLAPL